MGQTVRLCERLVAEAVECVKAAEGAAAHAPAVMIEVMTFAIFNPFLLRALVVLEPENKGYKMVIASCKAIK